MKISLPESLKAFVDTQVAERGYASSSEYVCELIRQDQGRQSLRSELLVGASSPLTEKADDVYFERLQSRIESAHDLRTFFAECDTRAGQGPEPDWEQHRSVIDGSRRGGPADS